MRSINPQTRQKKRKHKSYGNQTFKTTNKLKDCHITKLQSAVVLYQQGNNVSAEALVQEILRVQPNHFDALRFLATIALLGKNYIVAVDIFDRALKINPHHIASLNNCGNALHALMRYEDALKRYDKALSLKPDYAEAFNNRGAVLKELHRYEEAFENYDHALALKPDYTEALANRALAEKSHKENKKKTDTYIADVLKVKSWLRSTESMSLDAQRKMQDTQLRDLFRHAWQYSSWWRQRLTEAGYRHDDNTNSVFSVFERIPPLLRTDLQEHFEAMRAWRSDWTDKDIVTSTTSGSTGMPVRVEKFEAAYNLMYEAVGLVDHEWHQRDARHSLLSLSDDVDFVRPDWGPLLVALQGSGSVINRLCRNLSTFEYSELLIKYRPAYLKATSFRAAEIAELLNQQDQTIPLKHIISQYERVTPRQREVCNKAFVGAKIIDRYSCEEAGWIALQCPKHDHLHVMSSTTIVEIVDDDLKPCPVGVVGRVLVTNLQSYAMPIIRYDIGDIAEWGEDCDCGIKYPVISRLWGRKRNKVMLTSGSLVPMRYVGDEIAEIPVIKEFRMVQKKNGHIDCYVRVDRPLSGNEIEKVQSFICKVDAKLTVNILEVSAIDWGTGLKREALRAI